ncbi:MAG: BMP family ABC transporter substrate-binding protein [Paracoccaceae bacterium]|nr:BMP family ABC transporter substrate-binding protein [Paracoccaceae bacterium]
MKLKSMIAGAMIAAVAGFSAYADGHEPTKVAFVYVGPKDDGGWSQQHHAMATEMAEHFGDAVEFSYLDAVPEAESERVFTQLALAGNDIIFGTSFGYMDPMLAAAARFPDVKFEHATGYKTSDNMSNYGARFYEGRAIMGHIAGRMTETNKIGYIASFPVPEVLRGMSSAYVHAKKANPDVEMTVVWLNTWFDPPKEADATQAMIDQGIDVVLAHTDSIAPLQTIQASGQRVFGFGQAADMIQFAPAPRLSSIIDNWAPYYIARVQAVKDGTWESAATWHGIEEEMVGIGAFSEALPEDVRAEAQALMESIVSGEYHPFTGPLNKQDGSAWLADGEVANVGDLLGMGFVVEGLDVEIPN